MPTGKTWVAVGLSVLALYCGQVDCADVVQSVCADNGSVVICPSLLDLSSGTAEEEVTVICKPTFKLLNKLEIKKVDRFNIETLLAVASGSSKAELKSNDPNLQVFGSLNQLALKLLKPSCQDTQFRYRCINKGRGIGGMTTQQDAMLAIVAVKPTLKKIPDKSLYRASESVTLRCRASFGQMPGSEQLVMQIQLQSSEQGAWETLPNQLCSLLQGEEQGISRCQESVTCTSVIQASCNNFRCIIIHNNAIIAGVSEELVVASAACGKMFSNVLKRNVSPVTVLIILIVAGLVVSVVVAAVTFFYIRIWRKRGKEPEVSRAPQHFSIDLAEDGRPLEATDAISSLMDESTTQDNQSLPYSFENSDTVLNSVY